MSSTQYSFSKINFYLEVTGTREDGFHNIHSYFIPLNWYDSIQFYHNDEDQDVKFKSNDGFLNDLDFSHLTIGKAAELLKPHRKNQKGIYIDLEKRVPYGAGLGIASSNALSTLKALNSLWECDLSEDLLRNLSSEIGSDCSFFSQNQISFCEGKGDVLTSIVHKPLLYPLWILKPKKLSINTAQAYKRVRESKAYSNDLEAQNTIKNFFVTHCYEDLPTLIFNTFYNLFEAEIPLYREMKNFFEENHLKGGLSGSGPSFFILFRNKEQEQRILKQYFDWIHIFFDFHKTIY